MIRRFFCFSFVLASKCVQGEGRLCYKFDVGKEVWMLMLTGITVLISAFSYRETVLSRTEKKTQVDVEWKIPAKVCAKHQNSNKIDMYFFIEGIFTNSEGKTVLRLN